MTNSESASQAQDTPADESTKKDVDAASKNASPQEKLDGEHHRAQEVEASPSASPSNAEIAHINNGLTGTTSTDEEPVGRALTREEMGTGPEEVGAQPGNFVQRESQGNKQKSPLRPNQAPTHFQADNIERKEPAVSKQAVQDPGLVDITGLPPETNIIDVDTFDDEEDDVSEDDADQSPTADEFVSEAEEPDDPENIDTIEVLAPDPQGESIDLTESPLTKPLESAKQGDGEDFKIDDTSATGRAEPIAGRLVDADEARESPQATEVKGVKIVSGAQDHTFSMTKNDERPDEGTPDTDTVSADVNMDTNGGDFSPQQVLREDDSAILPMQVALNVDYSADEAGHIERGGDQPMTAARSGDVADDENGRGDSKGENRSKVNPADVLDADGGNYVNRNIDQEMVPVELENSNVDNGSSNMRILENKSIDDGSAVIALDEKVAPKAEEDEALPSSNDELQTEDSPQKNLHSLHSGGRFARYHNSSETTVRSDKTRETITVPRSENQSSVDLVTRENDTAPEPLDASPKLQNDKAQGGLVAPAIAISAPKGLPMSVEPQLESSVIFEKTDQEEPVEPDGESSAVITEIHQPLRNETAISAEQQLFSSGLEPQQLGEDKQRKLDNSKMDAHTGFAEGRDNRKQRVAPEWKAPSNVKASSDKSVPPHSESNGEGSGSDEKASTHLDQNSKGSGMKAKVAESEANHLPEQSKGTGTGHQAPLFGIQLSMPIKTGSVSFSSPPTFPRYSLNPQAVPFFPPKRSSSDESPEKSKTIVPPIVATPDATNQEKISGTGTQQDGTTATEDGKMFGRGAVIGDKNAKTEGLSSKASSTTATESHVRHSAMFPAQIIAPTDKTTKGKAPAEREVESRLASEPESLLKKPTLKKVSFAPTPVKKVIPLQQPEKAPQMAKKGSNTAKLGENSALIDASSVSNEVAKSGKRPTEIDAVKEKQRIVQVQTDEGLRREVANVTVAIRQDNSKMKLDRKKLTIQLTTGTEDSGKLQFFKGSGSSLKLYASLESKKDYLRVRKVTNRQYCMSVAKMAPPGDDAADIIEKYFVHFDERDIFEEMYSQCLANLQKQPKTIPHFIEPDGSKKAAQATGTESTEYPNRQSITKSGVKRSAESGNAAQVSKKSKLLADKKKLLDKMAALRRKKEQKGVGASKGRQSQQVAMDSAPSSLPSTDMGTTKSTQLIDKKVQLRSENTERNAKETSLAVAKVTHPSKRRANEKASKDKVSKRARITSPLSADKEANVVTAPKSGAEPDLGLPASVNAYSASIDGAHGGSTETKTIPSAQPNSSKELQSLVHQQSRTLTEKKLPVVDSDSPKHMDAEALVKATKDFKQAQRERDALQQELAAINQSLLHERAKTSQVQREHSDAWQRILSIVEALGDDMGRLRRDETDRSVESLKRCEPSSSEDFFDRLHSFRPSTWAAFENREIGALECALRGWHNSGPNTIRSSEGSEIALSPSYDDFNLRQGEVERVRSLLREGHVLLSGWIGQACPESFRAVEGSQRTLTKENLKANTETLRGQGFEGGDFRFDWGANALLLSDDVCERLAVYNWSVDGECLRCIWCNRRVVVHRESRFNASSKHYAFCPFRSENWKDSVLRNARTLGIEGDGDILMRN